MKELKELKQLKKDILEVDVNYIDDAIYKINNLILDYGNKTQDYSLDDYSNEFGCMEIIEEYVKSQLNDYGLERLPYLLGNTTFEDDYYIINAYGNLENVTSNDIEVRVDEIIDAIDDLIKENN